MTTPPNDPAGYGSGGVRDVGELPRIATPEPSPAMPTTPELDRQSEIIRSGAAGHVQEFIDWLAAQDYLLAQYQYEAVEHCPGIRRDPFDPSNCEDGKVKKTVTQWQGNKRVGRVEDGTTCPVCEGTGEVTVTFTNPPLNPVLIQPEQLMADFFGIDRDKIEAERRALLDALREQS